MRHRSAAIKGLIRWENKHRLIPHIVVFSLLTILTIKLLYRTSSSNDLLYGYGIVVTTVICVMFILSFTSYKDPYIKAHKALRKNPDRKRPFVGCVVAVFNEEDLIERCVQSMVSQDYKNKEVIIVNDASTDRTGEILNELAGKLDITVIHLRKNKGKKGALSVGTLHSKGTIFAYTDSDSTWAPDAISKIVEIFEHDPKVGAVSGHTRALNGGTNLLTKVQDSWYEGQYSIRKAFESIFGAVTCVSGPLAVFRKETIWNFMPAWEHDMFLGQEFKFATDRTLTGFALGGKYIGKKLKQKYADSEFMKIDYPLKNWKIVYCKSSRAWTHVPDSMSRVLKQQIRWKKSFIRNIFFTGKFYWRKPFLPAMVYYLHIAFVLLGPFIAFRHVIYLPLHGDLYSALLYFSGILFIGFMFGLAFKLENPESNRWIYRPLMSILSTTVLSWLIFYSAATIKKMHWSRA